MRWVHSVLRSQAGVALVMALLTVVVLLLVGAGLVTAAMTEVFTAQVAEDSGRALNVAEAGLAHAIQVLRRDPDWSDSDGATAGCGGSPFGEEWKVLKDNSDCLQDVSYPRGPAISVSPAGSGQQGECTSVPVQVGAGGGGNSPPGPAAIGTYTVYFKDGSMDTLHVRVVGKVGRGQRGVEAHLKRVTPADFVAYSALRVDATRLGNGTFRISGSVYVRGDWLFKGTSEQRNERPVSAEDLEDPVYDNQTFVCGNLHLWGNVQIGTPQKPMRGVSISGRRIDRGGAMEIYSLRQGKVVPDVQLGAVDLAIQCIRGIENEACREVVQRGHRIRIGEFSGLLDSYTNELDSEGLVVFRPPSGRETSWQRDLTQLQNLTLGTLSWRIPKRGQAGQQCQSASPALEDILRACAAYYEYDAEEGKGKLYVAGRQVIYIPGALRVKGEVNRDVDVEYRVDDDPSQPCNPAAGDEQDPCKEGDGSMFVVACESGSACNPGGLNDRCLRQNPPDDCFGFQVRQTLRVARTWAPSQDRFFYPQTTFPTRDLLAVLVNGKVQFRLSGHQSQQEINLVVLSGCASGLAAERCDLSVEKDLQLYGSVISRQLVFKQNVDLYQVPDLRRYLPLVLDRFLNAPGGAAVVVTSWREIGF